METNTHDQEARVLQRIAANDAVDRLTEPQMRSVLRLMVADSFLLNDRDADHVLCRITQAAK